MQFKNLIKREIDYYVEECNFTDDELEIFSRKCKGESRIEISIDLGMSIETVTRITNNIKSKMKRVTIK